MRYVDLAGDVCHDRRILAGRKEWKGPRFPHQVCCIHAGKRQAMAAVEKIRELERVKTDLGEVEIVLAHDAE